MKLIEAVCHLFDSLDITEAQAIQCCSEILANLAIQKDTSLTSEFSDGTVVTASIENRGSK
jgi:hypothetical protein